MAKIWSDPTLEPKRQFRWLVSFGNVNDRIPSYLCQKVKKPGFTIKEKDHKFLNHTFYYPGSVTWESVSLTIVDPLDNDAASALEEVLKACGYVPPGDLTRNVPLSIGGVPGQLSTISKARAMGAIGEVYIKQIDANGTKREVWTLHNAWIKSVKFGDLDYGSEDLVNIEMEFQYDWATQEAFDSLGAAVPEIPIPVVLSS